MVIKDNKMKKHTIILMYCSVFWLFSACDSNEITCIRVSTNTITETRDISDYSGVVMNAVGRLIVVQGAGYSFKISGPENVVSLTKAEIQNNLLVIGSDACFNGDYELVIEVSAPQFDLINLSGVGTIETATPLSGDIIEVELMGIGTVDAEFIANTLHTTMAGQGTLIYSGSVDKHTLVASGQFTLNGYTLITNHTEIEQTGIGISEVTANETLKVTMEGSGSVLYKGTPAITSNITGTGEIVNAN
jgi:hypothetical protein